MCWLPEGTLNSSHTQYLLCPGTCKENPPNTEFAYVILKILASMTDVWEQDELRLENKIKDLK